MCKLRRHIDGLTIGRSDIADIAGLLHDGAEISSRNAQRKISCAVDDFGGAVFVVDGSAVDVRLFDEAIVLGHKAFQSGDSIAEINGFDLQAASENQLLIQSLCCRLFCRRVFFRC